MELKSPLINLFQNYPGIDILHEKSSPLPLEEMDCYTHLLSLPYLLKTRLDSIPPVVPFNYKEPERKADWKTKIKADTYKVGFVWAGSKAHKNDKNRSCELEDFIPLFDTPGTQFYSIQKGDQTAQLKNFSRNDKIINLEDEIEDFLDTALAIEQLDLVITVDTSVAHLSGTLGKPTWVLLPYAPDWRWLIEREDSPWYPSVKLFRQKVSGEWEEVIGRIKEELMKQIKSV